MKSRNEFNLDTEYQEYLRVYFAAMTMQGILSSPQPDIQNLNDSQKATYSVIMADHLIANLNISQTK